MTTQHMALAIAIAERFKASPDIAGDRVYVNRSRALSSDKTSAVVVRVSGSGSKEASQLGGRTSWDTLIEIECYGRDGADDVPGTRADQVLELVFDNLDSADGMAYGVMSVDPMEGRTLDWDFDQLDTSVACVTARFVVKHQTNGRTLKL